MCARSDDNRGMNPNDNPSRCEMIIVLISAALLLYGTYKNFN